MLHGNGHEYSINMLCRQPSKSLGGKKQLVVFGDFAEHSLQGLFATLSCIRSWSTETGGILCFWLGPTPTTYDPNEKRWVVRGAQACFFFFFYTCGYPDETCLARCRGKFLDQGGTRTRTRISPSAAVQLSSPYLTASSLPLAFA